MSTLTWESAETDEPGDQNASTEKVAHGFWSLGPNDQHEKSLCAHHTEWGVELIEQDENLVEIRGGGIHLGHFSSESAAKAAAQLFESYGTLT